MTGENVQSGGREVIATGLLAVSLIFLLGWIFDPANVIRVTWTLCFIIGPPAGLGVACFAGMECAFRRERNRLGYLFLILAVVCVLISMMFMAVLDP